MWWNCLPGIYGTDEHHLSLTVTTIKPRIAWMDYTDGRKVAVADLPGLIEGAWDNVGMGHRFLKHIERTKLLLFLVDINGFQLNTRFPFRDPIETILILNRVLLLLYVLVLDIRVLAFLPPYIQTHIMGNLNLRTCPNIYSVILYKIKLAHIFK